MADEIQAGDMLSYTVFGYDGPAIIHDGALDSIAQIVSSVAQTTSAGAGPNSFVLTLRSRINRARVADLKGELDSALQTVMGEGQIILPGARSTLNIVSRATPAPAPRTGNQPAPPDPASSSGPLAGLAHSLNISESTLWWAVGGLALFLMVRK